MSWWAQKIAERSGAAPRPAANGARPAPAPPPAWGQAPGQTPTPPPQGYVDERGNVHAWMAASSWKGSRQAQQETSRCPNCDSGNYFSMSNAEGIFVQGMVAKPRPHCYDCGYPNLQSGSGMGVQGVPSEGPVRPARQVHGVSNFRPDVIVGKVG